MAFLFFAEPKYEEVENMVEKAIIGISLVEESSKVANKDIEKEIIHELSREPTMIPWLKEVEKVKVIEEENEPHI